MIFLERIRRFGFGMPWLVLVAVMPLNCAKSQQPLDASQTEQGRVTESLDAEIFTEDEKPETLRVALGGFELMELEGQLEDEIWGNFEGKSVCVIPRAAGRLLEIVADQDLDGDGRNDLLLGELAENKCCPRQFTVLSYRGAGKYQESRPVGAALHLPTILTESGLHQVVIEHKDLDPYGCFDATVPYRLVGGELQGGELAISPEMQAVAELRVGSFDSLGSKDALKLDFDLDGDGKQDRITAKLWPSYRKGLWSLSFGNGKVMEDGTPFRRLGVLPSKTEGVHDLVVDRDRVLIWKGKRYEEQEH